MNRIARARELAWRLVASLDSPGTVATSVSRRAAFAADARGLVPHEVHDALSRPASGVLVLVVVELDVVELRPPPREAA